MTKRIRVYAMVVVVCALGVVMLPAGGRDGASGDKASLTEKELAARQEVQKERFAQLVEQMQQLAGSLSESDPESARALLLAVKQAKNAAVADDMARAAALIREGMQNDALVRNKQAAVKLQAVWRKLMETETTPAEKLEKLKRLRAALAKLDGIIGREKELYDRSSLASDADANALAETGAAIGRLRRKLKDLHARTDGAAGKADARARGLARLIALLEIVESKYGDVNGRTLQAGLDRLPALAEDHRGIGSSLELWEETAGEFAGKADKKIATSVKKAIEHTTLARKETARTVKALKGSMREDARRSMRLGRGDVQAALKVLRDALEKASADTPLGRLGDEQDELAGQAEKIAHALAKIGAKLGDPNAAKAGKTAGRAADAMAGAAGDLAAQDAKSAGNRQKTALELLDELDGQRHELAQLHRRKVKDARDTTDDQADEQDDVADETNELAGGKGKDALPGSKKLKQAGGKMSKASGNLRGGKSGEANGRQGGALKDLRDAREDIVAEIDETHDEISRETLASLDEMLRKILKKHQAVSRQSREIHADLDPKKGYPRTVKLNLGRLSKDEYGLSDDLAVAKAKLEMSGTSDVFVRVLGQARDDMLTISDMLEKCQAGPLTQGMQEDVEKTLQEMIDALSKSLAELRLKDRGGDRDKPGPATDPPTPPRPGLKVPPIAEAKLLLTLQRQINLRTRSLSRQVKAGRVTREQSESRHKDLANRQAENRRMAEAVGGRLR